MLVDPGLSALMINGLQRPSTEGADESNTHTQQHTDTEHSNLFTILMSNKTIRSNLR